MYCDESRIEFGDGGEDVAVDFGTPYEIGKALEPGLRNMAAGLRRKYCSSDALLGKIPDTGTPLDMLIDALNENEKLKAENADLKGVVALVQKVLEDMQRPFSAEANENIKALKELLECWERSQ